MSTWKSTATSSNSSSSSSSTTTTTTTTTAIPMTSNGHSLFYQRRSSLTTACPPSDKRYHKQHHYSHTLMGNSSSSHSSSSHSHRRHASFSSSLRLPSKRRYDIDDSSSSSNSSSHHSKHPNSLLSKRKPTWRKRLLIMPVIQLVGWTYLFICFCLSTFHLFTSFSLLPEQQLSRATDPLLTAAAVDWDQVLFQRYQQSSDPVVPSSQFNEITPQIRLSKMFSKSVVSQDLIRPYWFTSSIQPSKEALTLTTVVEWKELEALVRLAQVYEGPISATLIVPCVHNLHHEQTMQQLNTIRQWYETTVVLRRYVDLHLFLQPGGMRVNEEGELEETPGQGRGGGGYQKARNIARFFSRTDYVAMVPVTLLWMTQIGTSFRQHLSHLKAGDVLVLPTFGFPSFSTSSEQDKDRWPTDRQSVVEWVEAGEMGLLDENYELNNGPTSFITWRDAREPYRVPHYDYKYGPIFISTRLNHPWCEERFEDYLASCVYSIYLSGANLWVLPNDYAVSETVDRKETWTPQQRKIQQKLASKYRMEQCVFYARQFDQLDIFQTERAEHVRQECSKALLNLQKQKMISNVMKAERPSF